MKTKLFFIVLLSLFLQTRAFSQGHYPVVVMELQTASVANNVVNGQPDISDSTIFRVTMKIIISDTASITNLQVGLKKSIDDATIIFSKTFTYDNVGNFADGSSYSRAGYEITMVLGEFMGTINPYVELVVTNNSGNVTDPISYY
jgi:hypothetical protein